MRIPAIILISVWLAGCAGNKEFINVGSQTFRDTIPAGASVKLQVAAGDVAIHGVRGKELRAHVELSCQVDDKGCARRAAQVRFNSQADTSAILIVLEPTSMFAWHDLQARVEVQVPSGHPLFMQMGAGELNIAGMQNCVELDMYAGDAEIRVQRSVVGSVALDVGTGDTALVLDEQTLEGKRTLLVGAELEWNEGAGWCQVYGDLQFGDLTVHLDGDQNTTN